MNALPAPLDRSRNPDHRFRVAIVYEDRVVGRAAMDTYRRLHSEFEWQFDFHLNIWRFDLLQTPNFIGEAVRLTVEANAIILATHQCDELPEAIKQWVDESIPQKRGQTAILIALLQANSKQPGISFPTADYLKNAAANAGIDFLARQIRPVRRKVSSSSTSTDPDRRVPLEGWGLND